MIVYTKTYSGTWHAWYVRTVLTHQHRASYCTCTVSVRKQPDTYDYFYACIFLEGENHSSAACEFYSLCLLSCDGLWSQQQPCCA
jgi:hypothetical protein